MVAAYLIDPAGRGYDLDELAAREGIGARVEGAEGAGGLPERAVVTRALAELQAVTLEELGLTRLAEVELPLVDVLVDMENGVKLDLEALGTIDARVQERIAQLEREIHEMAGGVHDRLAPAARRDPVRPARAVAQAPAARRASQLMRVLQAIRAEHPIVPAVERWRAGQAQEHLHGRAARARGSRNGCPGQPPSTRRPPPPAASRAPTPTSRTSRSVPSWGARSARASWPSPATS